jgi:hypothetical protein
MLRLEFEGKPIEVRFYHKILLPTEVFGFIGRDVEESRRCTMVKIHYHGELAAEGISVCHSDDNFCRATGRKIALEDALFTLCKEFRTAVWKEYHKNCCI